MRKGTKILIKVVSVTVLSLIALPLLVSLLLSVPSVQNFVVRRAARAVSSRLGTTVAIDRVEISLLGKVRVEGFYVEDFQRDTLLYVGRLDAYVTGLGLFGGGIGLTGGEIDNVRLCLHETPEGEMNIKQVAARLSDPDRPKKGNFLLSVSRASIRNMVLCIERLEHRNPPYGIDFGHLHVSDLAARVEEFAIDGQTIHASILSLSARERSGFVLDDFSGRFYLTDGCLGFDQVHLATARSDVSIPSFSLVGNSWTDYRDFVGEVRLDGGLRRTTLATDDVAYFSPSLRDWHLLFTDVDVDFAGTVDDFTARVRSLRTGEATSLAAEATVRGLPDVARTHFDLDLDRLTTRARDLDLLARSVAHTELSPDLLAMAGRAGRLDARARFAGSLSDFDLRLGLATALGQLGGSLQMAPADGGLHRVRGNASARRFGLGRLLGRSDLLGEATLTARLDGQVGRGATDAHVTGDVTQFELKGYLYDTLRLDGRLRNRGFDGRIEARDPNLDFDFLGAVDLNDSIPRVDFAMDLRRADLAALHVNPRDSVSVLSARLAANAGGRSLDDLNGRIEVLDATYLYADKSVSTQSIVITGENSPHSKFIELKSDFADATFRSKTSYRTVFEYLRRSAWNYLPLLDRSETVRRQVPPKTAVADDYSLLSVKVRNFNPIADAVSAGLQIADGSSLQLLFNPASDKLSLKVSSEYIERKRLLATRLSVNASNRGDSLTVYASAEDLYAGGLHLPRLSVTGGARQGRTQLSAGFADTLRSISGLVSLRADVTDEEGPNGREVDLRILPSHLTQGDRTWQIFADRIAIDTARVLVDRFRVLDRGEQLLLDGVASRSAADSLTLRLHDFDLTPFARVAESMGYFIEGRASGGASVKSVFRQSEISADIRLDSVRVNNIAAPPMRLVSRWDFARNRAGVTVTNRLRRDTLVRGYFAPDRRRYYARLHVGDLDMGLLDPLLSGVISSSRGLASANLVLQGEGRAADLSGRIDVKDFSTTVDFTQVTYTLPRASVAVKNNRFTLAGAPVYDPEGNRGRLDLDLDLQHLSNISYDVRVAPERMLVLNTTSADNDLFYGHVYASGTARISGVKGEVDMEIAASTDEGSTFSMPLSGKSNIAYADFVTFVQPDPTDSLDAVARRKLSFERKRREKSSAASRMNIALSLDVLPNVEVDLDVAGNTLRARGEGTLNMQISPSSNVFEIYGDYTLTEGSFLLSLQQVINKRFTIESGSSIQWTGSPMNALLDIEAVYRLKASLQPLLQGTADNLAADRSVPVECVIRLGDHLSNPSITFDVRVPGTDPETAAVVANALSTPETVDTQFVYLLLFNSFMSEVSQSSSNIGSSVSAATGLEFVSNMVSNLLSTSDLGIIIRYRPKSELTSDEVDFGLSKSLIDNRLFLEAEGNYLIDNKQAVNAGTMSNFMGEAYITYLIDRGGSLRLKAFTQTIDRFDENQGLQETGIGIYYKEDFNNFRDLRRRVRERFINKERQERRQARLSAAAERTERDEVYDVYDMGDGALFYDEADDGILY